MNSRVFPAMPDVLDTRCWHGNSARQPEALTKPEVIDEKPVEEEPQPDKVEITEKADKKPEIVEAVSEVKTPEEPIGEEDKKVKETESVKPVEDKKAEPEKEEKKPKVFEKIDLDAVGLKKKKKPKVEDESLTEKEKKRLKALEMIRKDGKKSKSQKPDLRNVGLDADGQMRRKKPKKPKRKEVDLKEVQDTVKKTLASIDTRSRKIKRHKKEKDVDGELVDENVIEVTEFISANDLANLMDVPVSEIITKCLELGLVVSINQRLDIDTITLLAEEYGFRVELSNVTEFVEDEEDEEDEESEADLKPRAPIVTIMGHVDHGKTSLLDYLRHSHIVEGESGGITQHIGAYEVNYEGKRITFLDTPGHEAFTAMRARGAQVTDIVILIIAADDAVMPQTDEALDHAKAAGVKIVIAINKIDKPGANPERIRQQLAERNVLVEDWGGQYQCAEISAKSGKGIPELLEKVLLD